MDDSEVLKDISNSLKEVIKLLDKIEKSLADISSKGFSLPV